MFLEFLLTMVKLDEDRIPSPVSAVFRSFRFFFLMDPGLSAPNKTGTCPLTIKHRYAEEIRFLKAISHLLSKNMGEFTKRRRI